MQAAKQTKRILVVDDNVDAADLLQTMFAFDGHQVAVAYDGISGLEAALQNKRIEKRATREA